MKRVLHLANTLILILVLTGFLTLQLAALPVPAGAEGAGAVQDLRTRVAQLRSRAAGWAAGHLERQYTDHRRELRDAAFAWLSLNVLVLLAGWVWPRRAGDRITLEVKGGTVSITVRALEDSLQRVLRQDHSIKDARVKVVPERARVRVRATLTLIENANLPALEEAILDRLRHHFEVIFPADKPVEYEVEIQKLRGTGVPLLPTPTSGAVSVQRPAKAVAPLVDRPLYPDHDQPS